MYLYTETLSANKHVENIICHNAYLVFTTQIIP